MVHQEYGKTHQQLQNELSQLNLRRAELEKQKAQARTISKQMVRVDDTGIQNLQAYDTLLRARYGDEKGKFQEGMELKPSDIENINNLFQSYLAMNALWGRVSAGQAQRVIHWGVGRLKELKSEHESPSEDNNSVFQIVARGLEEVDRQQERVLELADEIGVKLNPKSTAVAEVHADGEREPASQGRRQSR
jgi:hypothetical protein